MIRIFKSGLMTIAVMAVALGAVSDGARAAELGNRYITVKGSDTMVHLVSRWAEEFMKVHPRLQVSVTGGGSGTGIAALINGTTNIAAASRKMKPKEKDLCRKRGFIPQEFVVARDGIAVVVNPANPVGELTMEQLKKIFTGAYSNWKQVGGPDQKIVVLSRESSSGTYVFFQEHVLKKNDYTIRARLMPATASIIQSVSADKWTIGYVGLGYALDARGKVKMIAVKINDSSPGVLPSESTVRSGKYPIARPLHLYTCGRPQGAVKVFVDFCLSPSGQKIVAETGYIPVH